MKNLKLILLAIVIVIFFTRCEKESYIEDSIIVVDTISNEDSIIDEFLDEFPNKIGNLTFIAATTNNNNLITTSQDDPYGTSFNVDINQLLITEYKETGEGYVPSNTDTTSWNNILDYQTSNSTYTCPEAGIYRFLFDYTTNLNMDNVNSVLNYVKIYILDTSNNIIGYGQNIAYKGTIAIDINLELNQTVKIGTNYIYNIYYWDGSSNLSETTFANNEFETTVHITKSINDTYVDEYNGDLSLMNVIANTTPTNIINYSNKLIETSRLVANVDVTSYNDTTNIFKAPSANIYKISLEYNVTDMSFSNHEHWKFVNVGLQVRNNTGNKILGSTVNASLNDKLELNIWLDKDQEVMFTVDYGYNFNYWEGLSHNKGSGRWYFENDEFKAILRIADEEVNNYNYIKFGIL